MEIGLHGFDGEVLHGLLEENSSDIVIRLDQRGFLARASGNIIELGLDVAAGLIPPHITDLAERDHAPLLCDRVNAVLAGQPMEGWFEFPVLVCGHHHGGGVCGTGRGAGQATGRGGPRARHSHECRRWYALSLRPVLPNSGEGAGAVGLLRSVQEVRTLEGELYARAVTDPLTGLANRGAFCANLRRQMAQGAAPVIALLGVDGMRSLVLRYGQRTADDVLWGFAKFLEAMALPDFQIAQLDGERFGVMMPSSDEAAARKWCEEALATFAGLASSASPRGLRLSASAGLAQAQFTIDWTLREAELGLVMARAGGGGQAIRGGVPGLPDQPPAGLAATYR